VRVREAISGLGAVLLAIAAGNSEHYIFTAGALLLAYAALVPPHIRFTNTLNNQPYIYFSIHGGAHFMLHDGMVPCHLPQAK
jgi:hypothetical protein